MRIIKPGKPPRDAVKWRGTCRACRAEVEAHCYEITHEIVDYREGGSFSWEVCPSCGAGDCMTGYGGVLFYPTKEATDG